MSKLTLTTCLFDLARRQTSTPRRTVEELLGHADPVLSLDLSMVIYADPELCPELSKRREDKGFADCTKVIPLSFEDLPGHGEIVPRLEQCHLPVNRNVAKDTPNMLFMGWNKPGLMARTAKENPFGATHIGWIDLGIAHAHVFPIQPAAKPFEDLPSKMRFHQLRFFNAKVFSWSEYWNYCHCLIAAGWMVGDLEHVIEFADDFHVEAMKFLDSGKVMIDEDVIAVMTLNKPGNYEFRYGGYPTLLNNSDKIRQVGWLVWYLKDAFNYGCGSAYCQEIAKEALQSYRDGTLVLKNEELVHLENLAKGPLLALVMIVKNESERIAETLRSVKPFIDTWSILDTGSTDGTQELIKKELEGVPGFLEQEGIKTYEDTGFIDYAETRNRGLELAAKTESVFYLLLNGDDFLQEGAKLREHCERLRNETHGGYWVRLKGEVAGEYTSTRLTRAASKWRYHCPTHEVLSGSEHVPFTLDGVHIKHLEDSWETRITRWHRDEKVLQRFWDKHPGDHRTAFYLAQTHECLGEDGSTADRIKHIQAAIKWYQKRADLGGWIEEACEARQRAAGCARKLGKPWAEVQQMYLEAHTLMPHRMEPIYQIAQHYHEEDNHALCYLFAIRGLNVPFPEKDALGVDREVYEWRLNDLVAIHAFYLNEHQVGRAAGQRAVNARPNDMRMRHNLAFYAKSAEEMYQGFKSKEIKLENLGIYHPTNPSVMIAAGRRSAVVRSVNYQIVNGSYIWPDDDHTIRTKNWWVDFDKNWEVIGQTEILDKTDVPRVDFPVRGYEDCRLFRWRGKNYLSAVSCDLMFLTGTEGAREIVLLELDDDLSVVSVEPIRGEWSRFHQKNWMPMVEAGSLSWIYSTIPFQKIGYSQLSTTQVKNEGLLRGGSQAVKVPGGWLWLVHEVTADASGRSRVYLHRFAYSQKGDKLDGLSPPFYLKEKGIEFAAGLALEGEALVASFGVADKQACLGFFPLKSVLSQITPV